MKDTIDQRTLIGYDSVIGNAYIADTMIMMMFAPMIFFLFNARMM